MVMKIDTSDNMCLFLKAYYELERILGKMVQLGVMAFCTSLSFDQSCMGLVLPAFRIPVVFFFFKSYNHIWRL
jgi:hypothetical protein